MPFSIRAPSDVATFLFMPTSLTSTLTAHTRKYTLCVYVQSHTCTWAKNQFIWRTFDVMRVRGNNAHLLLHIHTRTPTATTLAKRESKATWREGNKRNLRSKQESLASSSALSFVGKRTLSHKNKSDWRAFYFDFICFPLDYVHVTHWGSVRSLLQAKHHNVDKQKTYYIDIIHKIIYFLLTLFFSFSRSSRVLLIIFRLGCRSSSTRSPTAFHDI